MVDSWCYGLPWCLSGEQFAYECRGRRFFPWDRKILWKKKWQPTPVFLPGKPHGQRSLVGYSPCGHKESEKTQQQLGVVHSMGLDKYNDMHSRLQYHIKWITTLETLCALPIHPSFTQSLATTDLLSS